MADDDDLDGAPLEDLDGEPILLSSNGAAAATVAAHAPIATPLAFTFSTPASVVPAVSAAKVALFDSAPMRLTPFQKRQAEAEEKRAKAEEEAAKVYAQFVQSFDAGAGAAPARADDSTQRRGGPSTAGGMRGGRPMSSLLTHKAFVSGGVIGGDQPATAAAAAASSSAGAPATAAASSQRGASKLTDPAMLKSSLPSTSRPLSGGAFAFQSSSSSPAFAPSTAAAAHAPAAFSLADEAAEEAPASAKKRRTDKKRNIDSFLEEMKAGVTPGSNPATAGLTMPFRPSGGAGGERGNGGVDLGDAASTNLYVANLPEGSTEKSLCALFAEFGDIASVKIMWPRDNDAAGGGLAAAKKQHHCGFVSFMEREAAEIAMREMQDKRLEGTQLRLNWSRAIGLPSHALVLKTNPKDARQGRLRYGSESSAAASSSSSAGASSFVFPPNATKYQVEFPTDRALRDLIDLIAEYVSEYGVAFEQALTSRASAALAAPTGSAPSDDTQLAFLCHPSSLEHLYYRWKVYSLAQGDSTRRWRARPFQMLEGGPFVVPPDAAPEERERDARRRARENLRDKKRLAAREGADKLHDRSSDRSGGPHLSASDSSFLAQLLRAVTPEKTAIRDVMGWALDHAESSRDVVDIICEALTLEDTPVGKKIARLYVVSDILYNSSAPIPNASSYRSLFQAQLVSVFASLHRTCFGASDAPASAPAPLGRMSLDVVRGKLSLLWRSWDKWALFPGTFVAQLEHTFEKGEHAAITAQPTATRATSEGATGAAPMQR